MCGIFVFIGESTIKQQKKNEQALKLLERRGPDNTKSKQVSSNVLFGFTRLAINGLDESGDQPMNLGKNWLVCNGEIYNFHELGKKYNFQFKSGSDCEVILHMYERFGFISTIEQLVGVFSIALFDSNNQTLYLANDRIGIRPLFWGSSHNNLLFASEPISIYESCKDDPYLYINFFPPGTYSTIHTNKHPDIYDVSFIRYYHYHHC